nr:MAG TPA: hypothetical protein [Caudoviricetes sp.]
MTANKCGKMQFTSDVSLGVPLVNPTVIICALWYNDGK